MAVATISWLFAFLLLGAAAGLRTFTPMAALCWFAHLGYLPVDGTWAVWTSHFSVAIVFSLFALGEYVGDKLPRTPNRTSPGPLAARIVVGGLCGAICAVAIERPELKGIVVAAAGALIAAYLGYIIRRGIVRRLGCPDWPIAVVEDITAILAAMFALHVISG